MGAKLSDLVKAFQR